MGATAVVVFVLVALAGVLAWLARANPEDAAHLARALGPAVVPKGVVPKGRDPLMGEAQDLRRPTAAPPPSDRLPDPRRG